MRQGYIEDARTLVRNVRASQRENEYYGTPPQALDIVEDLADEVERLRPEIARLQSIINGMADRIASQSDALSRAAEGSPLARLEAWAKKYDGWFTVRPFWVALENADHPPFGGRPALVVYRCPSERRDYHTQDMGHVACVAGTDEKPATLGQMSDAALAKWEELHGE